MRPELTKIIKFLKKHISADDFKLYVYHNDTQDTRFAENAITQHIAGEYIQVYYQCVIGKRTGTASTRQTDESSLLAIIRSAEDIARNSSPDPDIETSMAAEPYPQVETYFDSIQTLDTARMVDIVHRCIQNAELRSAKLSGIITRNVEEFFLITQNGFEGNNKSSEVAISMTMRRDHIETKVSGSHSDVNQLNIDGIIYQLNSQFEALVEKRDMDFETIPVILRPAAVADLLMYLNWIYNRKSADEGLTPFSNKIGEKFLGEKFSIVSRINDPDLSVPGFSANNVFSDIDWIVNGVIKNMPTSRDWAQKHNLSPTSLFNMIVSGEGKTEEEMMKSVKRGLIINSLWYIRLNDMKTADLTGMTRDGVLYFEDGKIQYAVNNFRFNEKLPELTHRILATGTPTKVCTHTPTKVPAMLIDGFKFIDKTNF
jgi:predicted Zn-dependent protease